MTTEGTGNGVAVIALSGELDLYTCPEFKEELLRVIGDGTTLVVVDLTQTTFIDSTALGVLIRGVERLKTNDGRRVRLPMNSSTAEHASSYGSDASFP